MELTDNVAFIKHGDPVGEFLQLRGDKSLNLDTNYMEQILEVVGDRKIMVIGTNYVKENKYYKDDKIVLFSFAKQKKILDYLHLFYDRKIYALLEKFKPHLIFHLGSIWNMSAAIRYSKNNSIPLVIAFAGQLRKKNIFAQTLQNLLIGNMLIHLKSLQMILVRNADNKRILNTIGIPKEKITIYYPKYSSNFFQKREIEDFLNDSRKTRILYVGRLEISKGTNLIIEAIINIFSKFHDIEIIFIGDGTQYKRLCDMSNNINDKYREQHNVMRVLGSRPFETLYSYYTNVDITVLPSYGEGMPKTVIESLLSGTPVIASDLPGIREIVKDGETGYIFEAGNIKQFTQCIERCISNPEILSLFRTNIEKDKDRIRNLGQDYKEVIKQFLN
ncbi:MAG: glycosyltransferase family 4 protein [Nitrospirae bacterium]|nr:glycosyltransferase family 4 protein [Nitrospirota bacterium]